MKHLIIVLISLFTFSSYSSFATSNSEKAIIKIHSSELLDQNISTTDELSQIEIVNTSKSIDEIVIFGWICHSRIVNVQTVEGPDGIDTVTYSIIVTCIWYNPPQVGNVN